jgi:hypothetical protein
VPDLEAVEVAGFDVPQANVLDMRGGRSLAQMIDNRFDR